MPDKIQIGIVGLGRGSSVARQAVSTEGARLACICDLQEEKAKAFAAELECDYVTDFDALLARGDIDVVGIFTASGTHCDLAVQSLRAGKHTFMTKPMDIKVEKCDAAINAAKESGRILAVDFPRRYMKQNHQVKAAIDAGRIGRVFLGDLRMKWYRKQSYFDGGYPPGWRKRTDTEGGSLANQGVHDIDLLEWWVGPVKEVVGYSGTQSHEMETEDISIALLTFENGARGSITTTTSNYPHLGTTIELSGTEGTIIWRQSGVKLFQTLEEENVELDSIEVSDGPAHIIEDMVSCITEGTSPTVPGEEGRKSCALFNAVYESSKVGRPVQLVRN